MAADHQFHQFEALEARVKRVVPAGAPDYDEARERLTWNRRLTRARTPTAIVEVRSPAEVAAAIRFAAERGLKVSPRGGGHNYGAAALREGGILLDLGDLRRMEIDPGSCSAWVGAGVQGGELIDALSQHGLGFPIGHCADVALSGYILSGGFGWNSGCWGPASANVLAIEMVLADGRIVTATTENHPDLFWAARGAGCGFFAAVTAYRLRLHRLPDAACCWRAGFTAASVPALASWLNDAIRQSAEGTEITCLVGPHHESGEPAIVVRASATASSPERARGKIASFASPPEGAEQIDRPACEDMHFADLTRLSATPADKRVAADQLWSDAPAGELLLAIRHLAGAPDRSSTANIFALGGSGRVASPPDERVSALSVGGGTGVGIYAMWDDPADDARHLEWVSAVDAALAPFRIGRYVGEADLAAGAERPLECFTPAALQRLDRLRRFHDPGDRFFRFPTKNQSG